MRGRARTPLARRRARELLEQAGVNSPPIPLERLADVCRADIRYEPFEGGLSGLVHRRKGGRSVIGVNSLHSIMRQRFTIAHELGHLLLHDDEELHIDEKRPLAMRNAVSSTATDPKEIEANQFAAELLMPERYVRYSVQQLTLAEPNISVESAIEKLSQSFRVSQLAMTHRLANLKIVRSDDDVAG